MVEQQRRVCDACGILTYTATPVEVQGITAVVCRDCKAACEVGSLKAHLTPRQLAEVGREWVDVLQNAVRNQLRAA